MRRYRGFIGDSARWDGFLFRDDDIVICTPSKSGTTWMQTIVAMLVLDVVELDRPMGLLSPWLDMNTRSVEDVFAMLEAQEHRRFIKTHTPLDGVPWDDRVTYLAVVRHPLQVALSMDDHMANLDLDRAMEIRGAAVGLDDLGELPPPPERSDDPRVRLLEWMDDDGDYANAGGTTTLRELVHHARTLWDRREHPNLHLFHYADLCADLDAQMRRVAAALGIDPGPRWDEQVEAASFDRMKARADLLVPDSQLRTWRSNANFFRSGHTRRWDMLSDDDLAHFGDRLLDLAGRDLAAWMCHGGAT